MMIVPMKWGVRTLRGKDTAREQEEKATEDEGGVANAQKGTVQDADKISTETYSRKVSRPDATPSFLCLCDQCTCTRPSLK